MIDYIEGRHDWCSFLKWPEQVYDLTSGRRSDGPKLTASRQESQAVELGGSWVNFGDPQHFEGNWVVYIISKGTSFLFSAVGAKDASSS